MRSLQPARRRQRIGAVWPAGQISSAALFRLGLLLRDDRQQPVEAIALMRRAAALAPDDFDLQQALGESYRRVNCTVLALEAFQRAVEIAPDSRAAQFNLGSTLVEAGRKRGGAWAAAAGVSAWCAGGADPGRPRCYWATRCSQPAASGTQRRRFATRRGSTPWRCCVRRRRARRTCCSCSRRGLYNTPYRYLTEGETYGASLLLLVPGSGPMTSMRSGRAGRLSSILSRMPTGIGKS